MYSIIKKERGIVNFLAEEDKDILRIRDVCKPGSTVEVLDSQSEEMDEGTEAKTHTFIKSPSGKWSIYKGEASKGFEIPKNDAKVSVPSSKLPAPSKNPSSKKIEDYQRDIQIYPGGLVTGTLLNASSDLYGRDQANGHYLIIHLDAPKEAQHFSISFGDQSKSTENPIDDTLMIRLENVKNDKADTVTVKYDTEESFTFLVDELVLE